jgi:hypothetical protein
MLVCVESGSSSEGPLPLRSKPEVAENIPSVAFGDTPAQGQRAVRSPARFNGTVLTADGLIHIHHRSGLALNPAACSNA